MQQWSSSIYSEPESQQCQQVQLLAAQVSSSIMN
jgi:hypothetical protein